MLSSSLNICLYLSRMYAISHTHTHTHTHTQSSNAADDLLSATAIGLLHWVAVHDTATRSRAQHDTSAAIAGLSQLKWKETVRIHTSLTIDRPDLSSERAPHMNNRVTVEQEQRSGHESQKGVDAKTEYLTTIVMRLWLWLWLILHIECAGYPWRVRGAVYLRVTELLKKCRSFKLPEC
jgi:hypothetical protein